MNNQQTIRVITGTQRMKIINLLAKKPLGLTRIAYLMDLGITTTCHQLRILKEAGIVSVVKEGKTATYTLNSPLTVRYGRIKVTIR